MEDIQKKKIYDSLNQILQSGINGLDEEIQIVSFQSYYAIDGTSGMKFTAKLSYVELSVFAGFSNDSKYENRLLFGILKSEVDKKAEKSCPDTDSNGNRIYRNLKIDEKFLACDEATQHAKIEKWLRSKTEDLLQDCEMFDYAHERSYDNVSFMSWFTFVELPWLLFVGSTIWMCYLMYASENMTFEKIPIPCLVIFYGGVLAILLTLKFRFNVKKAKNLKFNLFKPYTWSVSKIAKVYFCVVFCFMFVVPLIWRIIKWILTIPLRIIAESSESSSRTSSSRQTTSQSYVNTKTPKMYWYLCHYCGTPIQKSSTPNKDGCPNKTYHSWFRLGEVGDRYYQCRYCGKTVNCKTTPIIDGCPSDGHSNHSWHTL